jgi:hypothetical protein
MDEVIWVEILRGRGVAARHRFAGRVIRIGRGYGNDLVLDDPHVAVNHIRIVRTDTGVLVAEDLGSANGMFAGAQRQHVQRITLDGTGLIRIGLTQLRVRESTYPLPAERPVPAFNMTWPFPVVFGISFAAIWLALTWLNETAKPVAYTYAAPPLILLLVAVAWSAAWTLLTYLLAGSGRFFAHLTIALGGLLAFTILGTLIEIADFSLSWQLPGPTPTILTWLLLAAAGFAHLRLIGPGRLVLKAAGVTALASAAIAIQLLAVSRDDGPQMAAHRLFPPALRLATAQTEDAFFAKADGLKAELDRDRTKPP